MDFAPFEFRGRMIVLVPVLRYDGVCAGCIGEINHKVCGELPACPTTEDGRETKFIYTEDLEAHIVALVAERLDT